MRIELNVDEWLEEEIKEAVDSCYDKDFVHDYIKGAIQRSINEALDLCMRQVKGRVVRVMDDVIQSRQPDLEKVLYEALREHVNK